jgi:hypothetical protein
LHLLFHTWASIYVSCGFGAFGLRTYSTHSPFPTWAGWRSLIGLSVSTPAIYDWLSLFQSDIIITRGSTLSLPSTAGLSASTSRHRNCSKTPRTPRPCGKIPSSTSYEHHAIEISKLPFPSSFYTNSPFFPAFWEYFSRRDHRAAVINCYFRISNSILTIQTTAGPIANIQNPKRVWLRLRFHSRSPYTHSSLVGAQWTVGHCKAKLCCHTL